MIKNTEKETRKEDKNTPHNENHPPVDTGLLCLSLMAQLHEIAINPQQLIHEHSNSGLPFSAQEILLSTKEIGLKAKEVTTGNWARLSRMPLPAIAEMKNGQFILLAKCAEDKVLIHNPLVGKPETMTKEEFLNTWNGSVILMTRRALLGDAFRRFDFSWFVPEIIKYRKLFYEVLAGSFFLQLFALVTPIFFQVVVDKVLVHQSLSTLDVLIFGLITVTIFETILGAIRTYLLAHTTSRIDVTLGARLFRHLLNLPIAYFEARRVGDIPSPV